MNANLPQVQEAGLGLLAAHLMAYDLDAPTARERLETELGAELAGKLVFALCTGAPSSLARASRAA
jgi:hypothetical protein